jgi:hypothetical protein
MIKERSIGLWRPYINVTITILDIIHRPVYYLKHDVPETESSLRNNMFKIKHMMMDNVQICDSY